MCRNIADYLDGLDFQGKLATFIAFCTKVEAVREEMPKTIGVGSNSITIAQTLARSTNRRYTVVLNPSPASAP